MQLDAKEAKREYARTWRANNTERCRQLKLESNRRLRMRPETWIREAIARARVRSKKYGYECTITVADVVFPECCPVFGTPFVFKPYGQGNRHDPLNPSL